METWKPPPPHPPKKKKNMKIKLFIHPYVVTDLFSLYVQHTKYFEKYIIIYKKNCFLVMEVIELQYCLVLNIHQKKFVFHRKSPNPTCAKLVTSYARPEVVIAAQCASSKYQEVVHPKNENDNLLSHKLFQICISFFLRRYFEEYWTRAFLRQVQICFRSFDLSVSIP